MVILAINRVEPVDSNTLIFTIQAVHCTEVRFASFLSGEAITAIVVNPPERKLAKPTSVHHTVVAVTPAVSK